MTMSRIIGLVFSGFACRIMGGAFAVWLASSAVSAFVDASQRITSAMP